MKLPDFYSFDELIQLKIRMGIPQTTYGELIVTIDPGRLTPFELDKLTSAEGLDIESLDKLRVLDDGTLAYKNSRVLLYIRDHQVFEGRPIEPRFHLAHCDTLQKMRERNRFERYVISTRLDGRFRLNLKERRTSRSELFNLRVCQNCLNFLSYEGFSIQTMPRSDRLNFVGNFSLEKYFVKFPRSLHTIQPAHDSDNAPLNDYVAEHPEISRRVREAAGWRCQRPQCRINLSAPSLRKYLHTHHKNGIKSDNRPDNLEVICIRCHAAEPCHNHMRALVEYKKFMELTRGLS
ncbi:MAG: HNH endonuclease [Rhodospirillales bacterium]|nr:HNH endonuclease [Rhodospirillales bacterium]